MFLLWLAVTLISNFILGKFGSVFAVSIVMLVLYAIAWFLFIRADIFESLEVKKTPVIALCVTLLTAWVICAIIGSMGVTTGVLAIIKGILLLLLIYSSAPFVYFLMGLGLTIDVVSIQYVPVLFGSILVLRILINFAYSRVTKKNK